MSSLSFAMQAKFFQVSLLLGFHVHFCAAAASSARVSKAARAAVSSEGSIIPGELLETINADVATPLLEPLADHAPAPVPLGVPLPVPLIASGGGALDMQYCHPLKLPAEMQLVAQEQTWRSLTGAWYGRDEVRLATWQRNTFRTDRVTMFINSDVERALMLEEVSSKTDTEMMSVYNWRAVEEPEAALNIPILDCSRRLAVVLRMREDFLHDVEIYSPAGIRLASTLIDLDRERLQFVDPGGLLIATAEAPAINSSLTRAALSTAADADRSYVLPYEIHFEAGGYVNASQLLAPEYRWAVAVAVQSRAALFAASLASAAAGEAPRVPLWHVALQVLGVAVVVGLVAAVVFAIYRLVYPSVLLSASLPRSYFQQSSAGLRKSAQIPAAKKFATFVERRQFPAAAQAAPLAPTAYVIRD